ncbi:unnamed protein product [Mytilus edulis]|uniref:C-type lectin domain-containing protein n=1 Tax=Mytilus edulis TaxID=6550 RepID=A0A8S3SGT2_MYTED|nr:unnamed protein product [Mytilus edulis]
MELELKILREKNVKGIITRAKARWQVEGEKGSNYFCNLEKKHYTEKIIPKLILEDETEITDPSSIRNEQKQFYKKLYTSCKPLLLETHRDTFLQHDNPFITKPNEEEVGSCQSYWLGGRDDVIEGVWMWASTDKAFNYTDWNPGQPDNSGGNENCLHMVAGYGLKWNDKQCKTAYRFICEKE